MRTIPLSPERRRSLVFWGVIAIIGVMILISLATPRMTLTRNAPATPARTEQQGEFLRTDKREQHAVQYSRLEGALKNAAQIGTVQAATLDRRVIRKGTLELIVATPNAALDQIAALAHQHGGYVVSSELKDRQENQSGTITIRVPAAQFDPARDELKKLAKRVESEQTSADDVTMQFAENEATLRNFRAEEASYIEIMKRSGKISDTLEVAEQLSDVRGRIERLQAAIRTMSLETEMSAIQVSVSAEPVAVATQQWRPLYELRSAWNDGVAAITTYVTAMTAILMYLPATLLWVGTIVLVAKLGWMLWRVGARLFHTSKPEVTAS